MPSPALMKAINRLEQAISHTETALDDALSRQERDTQRRDAVLTEVMGEIDSLISALRENS